MSFKWSLGSLAVPASLSLIAFLSLPSQWLFTRIDPGPLTNEESILFNALVASTLICYYRTVTVDPGRVPTDWKPKENPKAPAARQRWCRKCKAYKPPRAHHCKICKRCIPKMDHHCPWTINCVSHITYPHFLRFVGYSVAALVNLEYFLWQRASVIWDNRHMPSYLGPSAFQLALLFILVVANSMTLFALGLLFIRAVWCLVVNTYTIEGWEIERHHVLLRRSRVLGGYLDGPDGTRVRIVKQEFPYDIGFWSNTVQGMGTANVLAWFWPFAASPSMESGLSYETNGFEDPKLSWPPPDPDRMPRQPVRFRPQDPGAPGSGFTSEEIQAIRQRQRQDYGRHQADGSPIRRRQIFHKRFDTSPYDEVQQLSDDGIDDSDEGEESWKNREGEGLADFGVDEEVEFYDYNDEEDDEDVPLAELIRRKNLTRDQDQRSS